MDVDADSSFAVTSPFVSTFNFASCVELYCGIGRSCVHFGTVLNLWLHALVSMGLTSIIPYGYLLLFNNITFIDLVNWYIVPNVSSNDSVVDT